MLSMSRQSSTLRKSEESEVCCLCVLTSMSKHFKIAENFVKVNSKYLPIREMIYELNLIHYQVWNDIPFAIHN